MCNQLPQDYTVAEDISLHTNQHCKLAICLEMIISFTDQCNAAETGMGCTHVKHFIVGCNELLMALCL